MVPSNTFAFTYYGFTIEVAHLYMHVKRWATVQYYYEHMHNVSHCNIALATIRVRSIAKP